MKRPRKTNYSACHICAGPITRTDHMAAFCSDCMDYAQGVRNRASRTIKKLVLAGHLAPASAFNCTDCGTRAKFYDHRDYSHPEKVEPVCHSCNIRRGPGIYPMPQGRAA